MNPVFWIIIILAVFVLWLVLSFTFEPIGKFVKKIWKNITGGE